MSRVEIDFNGLGLSVSPVSPVRLLDIEKLKEAGAQPGSVALACGGGYRAADSSKLVVALSVRCAMQAELAKAAVSQLGNAHNLERIGFWPQSDKAYERVAHPLSAAVAKLLEYVRWFSVEDGQSLDAFVQACEGVLAGVGLNTSEAAGNVAREAMRHHVLRIERVAREALHASVSLAA